MLKNFLLTTWRIFLRNKIYAIINITGLSIGIAVTLIIYNYVSYELSFDKYQPFADRTYRINAEPFASLAPSWTYLLKEDFPEIEEICRVVSNDGEMEVKIGETSFYETEFSAAESNVFHFFKVNMLEGNPDEALKGPGKIVISKSIAEKYFHGEEPIGKQIEIYDLLYQVNGVFDDLPPNTHFHFELLASYESLKGLGTINGEDYYLGTTNFYDNATYTYLRLAPNADPHQLEAAFPSFIDKHLDNRDDRTQGKAPSDNMKFDLMKITDIHLHSHKLAEMEVNGDYRQVRIFSAIGLLILIMAAVNFINLSTARSTTRAREVGLKKIIGANRLTLIRQFFSEAFLYTIISADLSLFMVKLITSFLESSLHIVLPDNILNNFQGWLAFSAIIIITALLAGCYPALLLSGFHPLKVLKGQVTRGRQGSLLRKSLIVFQFSLSIGLIIVVIIIFRQMNYIKNANLGFNKENVLLLPMTREAFINWVSVKADLEKNPDVVAVTRSKYSPGHELLDDPGFRVEINGEMKTRPFSMPHNRVDFDFFKTYGIQMIAGRTFNPGNASDSMQAYIINEAAVRSLGLKNPEDAIGLPIGIPDRDEPGQVIGVIRDFNYESLHKKISPLLTYLKTDESTTIAVRLTAGNLPDKINSVKATLRKRFPYYAFNFTFLDEHLNNLYAGENRQFTLFKYFCAIAVFIALIGLMGLSIFSTVNRKKEIGIRKVNGASVPDILMLLIRDFTGWVFMGFIIILPFSYWFIYNWLSGFAYKTNVPWWVFPLAFLFITAVAFITVGYQTLRASVKNPVEALRYE